MPGGVDGVDRPETVEQDRKRQQVGIAPHGLAQAMAIEKGGLVRRQRDHDSRTGRLRVHGQGDQVIVFAAVGGPAPRLQRAWLAGVDVDPFGDHERRQQANAELADGGDRHVAGGQLLGAAAGAGAADDAQEIFNIPLVHARPIVAEAQGTGAFVHIDANLAGPFGVIDPAQLNAVMGVLQQLTDKHIRFRVQAFREHPDQTLKAGTHLGHERGV